MNTPTIPTITNWSVDFREYTDGDPTNATSVEDLDVIVICSCDKEDETTYKVEDADANLEHDGYWQCSECGCEGYVHLSSFRDRIELIPAVNVTITRFGKQLHTTVGPNLWHELVGNFAGPVRISELANLEIAIERFAVGDIRNGNYFLPVDWVINIGGTIHARTAVLAEAA